MGIVRGRGDTFARGPAGQNSTTRSSLSLENCKLSADPFYLGNRVAAIESWRVRIAAGCRGSSLELMETSALL